MRHKTKLLFLLIPLPFFVAVLYLIPRSSSVLLTALFALLFLWYGLSITFWSRISPRWLIIAGIAFRLITIPSTPSLSDDFYRFIWDGKLLIHGENPFNRIPSDIPESEYQSLGLSGALYDGLNSPNYTTIYPPVNQAIFAFAASGDDLRAGIWRMKASLLLAEILSLLFLFHLLKRWKKPTWWLGFYALNPLVIIELTGNIHFEAWMICGLLGTLFLLERGNILWASLAFGLAIASKLLPIMLFPFFIRKLGLTRSLVFGSMAMAPLIGGFLLMPKPETVLNIFDSVGLYFENFEFNAGLYHWLLWLGADGALWGKTLGLLAGLGILVLAFFRKNKQIESLAADFLLAFTVYFALARIIHPWYICPLVALAVLGRLRYPMIWTALLPLTYLTYQTPLYHQPYLLMGLCWLAVFGLIWFEFRKK